MAKLPRDGPRCLDQTAWSGERGHPCHHVRRKFFELAATAPVATEVLRRIVLLYVVEDEVRGFPPEHRRAARAERSRAIVDDLRVYLDARLRQLSAKRKLPEAIRYALSLGWTLPVSRRRLHRPGLQPGRTEHQAPGPESQKCAVRGLDEGGDNCAVIATLIECCKLNGVNPHAWLTVTISKLAAGHPANQLAELMP